MSTTKAPERRKRTSAAGIVLTALGLVVLVLCLSHLGGPGSILLLACQAIGGVILGMAGFTMMVVGADPFADDDAQFPTVDSADEESP